MASAIADFGIAITILTSIQGSLAPQGEGTLTLQSNLARARASRGNAYLNAHYLAFAIADYEAAIRIMTEIREALSPRGEWSPDLQNDLALAHMNRGAAFFHAEDLALAMEDFEAAIDIMMGIREALSPMGEWAPSLQRDLASAHKNRGLAHEKGQDPASAIIDFGIAIKIMMGIRDALLPGGEWSPALQDGLASAHTCLGDAYRKASDPGSAIAEYGLAIAIRTGIRDTLSPRGEWSPAMQIGFAGVYTNRANAYLTAQDHLSAICDYSFSIAIQTRIRDALHPLGNWSPPLQHDLATAHMNRGNAYQHAQDLTSAINDYGVAITIQTLIRDTVLHRGEWSSDLQFALASAHVNRGIAFAVSNNAHSVTADWGVALSILRLLANEQPDVSVDVQRLLANWFMLGKGLTTDHVRLALFNLKRLIGRFDAQTLSLLEIPKFNGQIANGLRSVRPALTFAQINAVHAALLGTA